MLVWFGDIIAYEIPVNNYHLWMILEQKCSIGISKPNRIMIDIYVWRFDKDLLRTFRQPPAMTLPCLFLAMHCTFIRLLPTSQYLQTLYRVRFFLLQLISLCAPGLLTGRYIIIIHFIDIIVCHVLILSVAANSLLKYKKA